MSDSDSGSMMRSMMGFSSFGTQRPDKKASHNPPSTGSNAAPVAKKARTGVAPTTVAEASTIPTPAATTAAAAAATTTTTARSAPGATTSTTTTFQSTTAPQKLTTIPPLPPAPSGKTNTSTSKTSTSSTRPTSQPIAYTSPSNPSYNLTLSELNGLRSGRPNARGDTVYFKPGFIAENPWEALKDEMFKEEQAARNEG